MRTGWAAICRFGGIGDNLIAASVLPLLARKYKGVDVITEEPNSVIFKNNPHLSRVIVKTKEELPNTGAVDYQKWFANRANEYDLFVNLSHSCENLLAMQAGQTQFYWPAHWRRKHCGKNYLETVHDICGLPHVFGPLFYPTEEEVHKALLTKDNLGPRNRKKIAWVISGSRLDKTYPYSAQAVSRLISELNATVLLIGAPSNRDVALAKQIGDEVKKALGNHDNVHAAISPEPTTQWKETAPGKRYEIAPAEPIWPVRRMLTQVQKCDLVIGPDTGAMWAVALEDIPKIVLLSHASPENITKHWRNTKTLHASQERVPCWPCHQLHDDEKTCKLNEEKTAAACMSDISAQAIVSAAAELLDDNPKLEMEMIQYDRDC
jgi:ADP-heptose:LPS heptosyltransferase